MESAGGPSGGAAAPPDLQLNIEVERELPGMRAQPDRVHLVLALVLDPRLDDVGREHVALEEPVVGLLEVVEDDTEIAGQLLDLLRLCWRQLVEVLVDRLAWIDLVSDSVEARHEARREREVGVAGRVRSPEFNSFRAFGLGIHRDADAG